MSIDIRVSASMISVKKKGISLTDCRIIDKCKKRGKTSLTDKIEISAERSSEKVDKQNKRRSSDCMQKNDIVKKKERSSGGKLTKYEKRYRHLEKVCHKYISPRDNQDKSTLETDNSKSTKSSTSTLLELAQEVLHLEREVNTVLSSGTSRQRYDYKNNITSDDSCESIDFLLKIDDVKRKLLDDFDLDLTNQDATCDDSLEFENATSNSTVDEFQQSLSEFSNCSDDVSLTEELLMNSKRSRLEITPTCANDSFDENEQTNFSNDTLMLSDILNILPSFSRNSLLQRQKPPASLMCKQYKRMEIDFTIHELSAIYEADSDGSRG